MVLRAEKFILKVLASGDGFMLHRNTAKCIRWQRSSWEPEGGSKACEETEHTSVTKSLLQQLIHSWDSSLPMT
jgi:hypothetical protein